MARLDQTKKNTTREHELSFNNRQMVKEYSLEMDIDWIQEGWMNTVYKKICLAVTTLKNICETLKFVDKLKGWL